MCTVNKYTNSYLHFKKRKKNNNMYIMMSCPCDSRWLTAVDGPESNSETVFCGVVTAGNGLWYAAVSERRTVV